MLVRIVRPKFVRKRVARDDTPIEPGESPVLIADPPERPIERGLAGPGLLAKTIVYRWQDHLPLYRQEKIHARDGLELARSTICGWHEQLADLAERLVEAMLRDAFTQPYLCVDATGVLVQAEEQCRRAHFWVLVAPGRHVLYRYSHKHDSEAVDHLLAGYKGHLVADAHSVYDHLYRTGDIVEVGCWAHCRRYFYKALASDPARAEHALSLIRGLYRLERPVQTSTRKKREEVRRQKSRPLTEAFFAWCEQQAAVVLDETPIARALGYARNQRAALCRFLDDGRLPLDNNISEQNLRREVLGRKNWLFLGSDEGARVNTIFVSLLASCQLHGIEPWAYLRDLLCLLPSWARPGRGADVRRGHGAGGDRGRARRRRARAGRRSHAASRARPGRGRGADPGPRRAGGACMIPSTVRIFVCTEPQDMRRSFDGLALATRQVLGQDPRSGALFVFANRRGRQLRVLWWDGGGYNLLCRRLHQALFQLPKSDDLSDRSVVIDRQYPFGQLRRDQQADPGYVDGA